MKLCKKIREYINLHPVRFVPVVPIVVAALAFPMAVSLYPQIANEYITFFAMFIFEIILMFLARSVFDDKENFNEIYKQMIDDLILIFISGLLVVSSELNIIKRFITPCPEQDFIFLTMLFTFQKIVIEIFDIYEKDKNYKKDKETN